MSSNKGVHGDERTLTAMGHWFEATQRALGWGYERWYHDAASALAEALTSGADPDEEAVRLGMARAESGAEFHDVLADLSALFEALPSATLEQLDDARLTAAVAAGFESVGPTSLPSPSGFDGLAGMRGRLADLYRLPGSPRQSHGLMVIELEAAGTQELPAGAVLHLVAQHARTHFPFVDRIACLGPARLALLVRRHPGLALTVATLHSTLRSDARLVGSSVGLYLRALPESRASLARFVRSLSAPAAQWAPGHAAAGDPFLEAELAAVLADTPRPTDPVVRPSLLQRTARALESGWQQGLSLLGLSVAAVVLAFTMVRVVGPAHLTDGLLAPVPSSGSVHSSLAAAPVIVGVDSRGGMTGSTAPPQPVRAAAVGRGSVRPGPGSVAPAAQVPTPARTAVRAPERPSPPSTPVAQEHAESPSGPPAGALVEVRSVPAPSRAREASARGPHRKDGETPERRRDRKERPSERREARVVTASAGRERSREDGDRGREAGDRGREGGDRGREGGDRGREGGDRVSRSHPERKARFSEDD